MGLPLHQKWSCDTLSQQQRHPRSCDSHVIRDMTHTLTPTCYMQGFRVLVVPCTLWHVNEPRTCKMSQSVHSLAAVSHIVCKLQSRVHNTIRMYISSEQVDNQNRWKTTWSLKLRTLLGLRCYFTLSHSKLSTIKHGA